MSDIKPCTTCKYKGCNIILAVFAPHLQQCFSTNHRPNPVSGKQGFTSVEVSRRYAHLCGHNGKWHSDNEKGDV